MLRRRPGDSSEATLASTSQARGLAARLPFHYSWVVIGILATVQIFASSISMAAGIMVPPLSDPEGDFGWNKSLIGLGIATYYGFGAIYAPFTGWLGDRFGSRIMLAAAAVMYLISMILLSQISEVWHFFLFFGVLLSLTQSLGMVPLMASVSGWFRRRLGFGIGILWAAGGIGTAAFAPLAGYLIETLNWQNTFLIIGLIGGIAMLCLVPLMRNRPSDLGIEPYGTRPGEATSAHLGKGLEQLRIKVFNQHIRRTRPFWNLPLIHGMGCAGHGIIIIYVALLALERGVFSSLVSAGFILAIISLVSIISRFVTPVLAEIYGTRRMMALSLTIQGLTVLILFWAQDAWVFYLFAVTFGIGFGGEWTGYLIINRQYFGDGPMGTVYGWQTTGALMGHFVATSLAGLVLYATGSYAAILTLSMAFSLGGVLVIALLDSNSNVLIPDWENELPDEARVRATARAAPPLPAPPSAAPAPAGGDGDG
jgi:MFS family permease